MKDLTLTLYALWLVTGQRGQIVHFTHARQTCKPDFFLFVCLMFSPFKNNVLLLLVVVVNTQRMNLGTTSCTFQITNQPGQPALTLNIQEFKPDHRICPIHTH